MNKEIGKSVEYSYHIAVMFYQIDGNQHVNNKHYNSYCDEAMMNMFKKTGHNMHEMATKGIGPVTYKAEYEYIGELLYGDLAKVTSVASFPKNTRAIFEHVIENAETGKVVCKACTYGIWINLESKKLHRFPDSILEKMLSAD